MKSHDKWWLILHELKRLAVLQAQEKLCRTGSEKPEHLDAMMRQVSSLKKLTQDWWQMLSLSVI